MDYGYPERRQTKGDKKAKRRYNTYKKGGRQRTSDIKLVHENKKD